MTDTAKDHRPWLIGLLVLVFLVYARSLSNDFCYDDASYVRVPSESNLPNDMVGEWQGFAKYFTSYYGDRAVPGGRGLRPITVMSFALVHNLFAGAPSPQNPEPNAPGAQHFVNVALHVFVTWLVFLLLRRVCRSPWPPLVAAACFGLHALRTDPVISIVGRAEILALGFGIGAQLAYLAALRATGGARFGWAALTALALFCAFGSKESSMAWVVFLPIFATVAGHDIRGQVVPWLTASVVPVVGFLVLWWPIFNVDLDIGTTRNMLQVASTGERLMSAVAVLGFALWQFVCPYPLNIDYSFNALPIVTSAFEPRFLASFVVLTALLVGGLLAAKRSPLLFLGAAMFFGFAFMTSNIPTIIETIYGERLMYTPLLGLSFVAAWATQRFGMKLLAVGYVLLGVHAVLIFMRCGDWKDSETLYLADAMTNPTCQGRQSAAGRKWRLRGQAIGFEGPEGAKCFAEWERFLLRALRAHPDMNHPDPLNDLAYFHLEKREFYLRKGDTARAIEEEKLAEDRIREAFASPHFQKIDGDTLYLLQSRIHARRGETEQQLDALRKSNQANPKNPDGFMRLSHELSRRGRGREALQLMQQATRNFPDMIPVRVRAIELAEEFASPQVFARMVQEGSQALPGNPHMQAFVGILHSRAGRHHEALRTIGPTMQRFNAQAPPPMAALLAIPTSLHAVGQSNDARTYLQQQLQNPTLTPRIRTAMEALLRKLPK